MKVLEDTSSLSLKIDQKGLILHCFNFYNSSDITQFIGRNFCNFLVEDEKYKFLELLDELLEKQQSSTCIIELQTLGEFFVQVVPLEKSDANRAYILTGHAITQLKHITRDEILDSLTVTVKEKFDSEYFSAAIKYLSRAMSSELACICQLSPEVDVISGNSVIFNKPSINDHVCNIIQHFTLTISSQAVVTELTKRLDYVKHSEIKAKILLNIPLLNDAQKLIGSLVFFYETIEEAHYHKNRLSSKVLEFLAQSIEKHIIKQMLTRSEIKSLALENNIAEHVIMLSPSGVIESINFHLPEMGQEKVEGSHLFDYLDKPIVKVFQKKLTQVCLTRMACSFLVKSANSGYWRVRLVPLSAMQRVRSILLVISGNIFKNATQACCSFRELQLEQALKGSDCCVWRWEFHTDRFYIIDPCESLLSLGVSNFDELLNDFIALIYSADRKIVKSALIDAQKSVRHIRIEFRIQAINRQMVWLLLTGGVVYDEKNNAVALSGVIQNINEIKRKYLKQQEAEHRWKSMIDNAPDFLALVNCEGLIIYSNKYLQLNNLNHKSEILLADFMLHEYQTEFLLVLKSVFVNGKTIIFDFQGYSENLLEKYYSCHISPIKKHGVVISAVVLIRDISNARLISKNLESSLNRYKKLVHSSGLIFWEWPDIQNNSMWWSSEFYNIFKGIKTKGGNSDFTDFLKTLHPKSFRNVSKSIIKRLNNKDLLDLKLLLNTKNFGYQWFHMRGIIYKNNQKQSVGILGTLQAIGTDLKSSKQGSSNASANKFSHVVHKKSVVKDYNILSELHALAGLMQSYGDIVLENYSSNLSSEAKNYLVKINSTAKSMFYLLEQSKHSGEFINNTSIPNKPFDKLAEFS